MIDSYLRQAYKGLLRALDKNNLLEPQEGFTHIYTDRQGNKWHTINNPANIHATRALTAWAFSRDAAFGMSREQLSIACDKLNDAVNKKDIATIAKVVGVIEAGLTLYSTPEILLNLATCYTFLNDEKNEGYKDFIQDKKREIWNTDADCKSFFLQWSTRFIQKSSELQNTNVLDYLEKVKPIIDQIDFQLQKK